MASIPALLIWLIIIAGIVAIAIIVLRNMPGLNIPTWVQQILWVILLVVIGVAAIRFLLYVV